jgi:hypothetical protein
VEFRPDRPPPRAGEVGTCRVKLDSEYRGEPAVVVVVVESGAGVTRHYAPGDARPSIPAGTMVELGGLALPLTSAVRITGGLAPSQTAEERRSTPADPLEGWRASVDVQLEAGVRAADALVGRLPETTDSIFQLLTAREPGAAEVRSWEGAFDHVAEGLDANLAPLIRERYVPYPDEVDERGQPITSGVLEPWQRWVIQYCTGLYYSAAFCVWQALEGGVGYPMSVECNTLADTCAWARGVRLNTDTLNDGEATSTYQALGRRAGASWEPVSDGSPLDRRSLRPGSMLTFQGHINVVLRVRRAASRMSFLLFDTGGVAGARAGAPASLLGSWAGVMKEEAWRRTAPSYRAPDGSTRAVTGHLFVPSTRRTSFPRTMFRVPPGATSGIAAATRASPTARLVIADRASGRVAFRSAALPLRVPFTQLHHSVSALPSSDAWEARWVVDGGRYSNHQGSGPLFIEVFNGPDGVPRHWRSAYTLHGDAALITPRGAEYLAGPGPPRSEPHEARLAALLSRYPEGDTVDLA